MEVDYSHGGGASEKENRSWCWKFDVLHSDSDNWKQSGTHSKFMENLENNTWRLFLCGLSSLNRRYSNFIVQTDQFCSQYTFYTPLEFYNSLPVFLFFYNAEWGCSMNECLFGAEIGQIVNLLSSEGAVSETNNKLLLTCWMLTDD